MLPDALRHVAGFWAKYILPKNLFKGLGFGIGFSHVSARRMENLYGQMIKEMKSGTNGQPI